MFTFTSLQASSELQSSVSALLVAVWSSSVVVALFVLCCSLCLRTVNCLFCYRQRQHISQLEQKVRESELQVHSALLGCPASYGDVYMLRMQVQPVSVRNKCWIQWPCHSCWGVCWAGLCRVRLSLVWSYHHLCAPWDFQPWGPWVGLKLCWWQHWQVLFQSVSDGMRGQPWDCRGPVCNSPNSGAVCACRSCSGRTLSSEHSSQRRQSPSVRRTSSWRGNWLLQRWMWSWSGSRWRKQCRNMQRS